ncbi:MAG: hypothetical protein ACI4UE_06770 [Candidatus Scatovivens sp.]
MFQTIDDTPRLKSLKQRKWYILIFWLYIIGGIMSTIFTFFMFFKDAEVFVIMIIVTSNFFYRAYLYQKSFNGYNDWESFKLSKLDIDEMMEIGDMDEGEEKNRRQKELKIRSAEYDRLWKITWKLKLLKRKENLYMMKVEKKKERFKKKREKLEKELVPRCEGIKM